MVLELFFLPAFLAITSASAVLPAAQTIVASAPAALVSTSVLAKLSEDTVDPNPSYSFAYDVQDSITGDSKGHIETRSNGIVQGQYNVADPDGTRRIVDYTADDINGFNALVRREPLVVAAQPVVAARTAKIITAPAAPLVAQPAPVVARASLVQAAPVIARASPLISKAAPLLIQSAPYVTQAGPVAQSLTGSLVARSSLFNISPYIAGASAPLVASSSFNLAPAARYAYVSV